jgi:RND family efflux transporter MFP subunit
MKISKLLRPPVTFLKLVIFLSILIIFGCGQEPVVEEKEAIRPVKYIEINPSGLKNNIEFSGKIAASQEVTMAFEVQGRITSFPVKEGQRVKKGQALAGLDPRDFQITINSRRADLNAAKAEYERSRELYENNTISKKDLDVARRNFEVAYSGLDAAKKSMGDATLSAPFSGLIAKTLVENYQNVQAKQAVLILQDDSSLEMKVDIPESDYAKVNRDLSLSELTQSLKPQILVSSFPDNKFDAEFKEAATMADTVTRTFEITFGFTSPAGITILPGMTARLLITGSLPNDGTTVMVAAQAILSDDENNATVWIIDPSSNQVKRHIVEIGEMAGKNIMVTKGLKSGDIIAASGVHQLREGMTVRKYEKP